MAHTRIELLAILIRVFTGRTQCSKILAPEKDASPAGVHCQHSSGSEFCDARASTREPRAPGYPGELNFQEFSAGAGSGFTEAVEFSGRMASANDTGAANGQAKARLRSAIRQCGDSAVRHAGRGAPARGGERAAVSAASGLGPNTSEACGCTRIACGITPGGGACRRRYGLCIDIR